MIIFEQLKKNLIWQPGHAAFQLSTNGRYARHEKHPNSNFKRIQEEVKRAWGLKYFFEDDWFWYFK